MSRAFVGKRLIESMLYAHDGPARFIRENLHEGMFYGSEVDLYRLCQRHVLEYGALPSAETVREQVGVEVSPAPEPVAFYVEQVRARHLYRELQVVLETAAKQMPEKKDTPELVLDDVANKIIRLSVGNRSSQIVDFTTDAASLIEQEYRLRWKLGDEYGLLSGWPTLDQMSFGLQAGDLLSIVGRPAQGKTYKMLYMASHGWHVQHKRVLFVSMEIKPLLIAQRLAAMYSHVPITDLRAARLTSNMKNKMLSELSLLPDTHPPFWIVDGNLAANVNEIIMTARRLQPDAVFVDGGYLLRHPNPRVSKHERIADNVEMLKSEVASLLNIPVAVSYQFNRQLPSNKKMKDGGNDGLEYIGGSDAIGQVSTIVLGLFQDDNPETKLRRRVQILKGRNGEVGGFTVNWLFDEWPYMDFSEVAEKDYALQELDVM